MVLTRQAAKLNLAGSGDGHRERTSEPAKTRGTKRARATKTTGENMGTDKRRKKAKLSMLPGMPVDILYEIFSLVHPRDLLHISWTTKVLNEFLTSKSSRHIWQASFRTITEREQLPSCPSEMTEMAYANLVYGQYCMNCAGKGPTISAWSFLMRICGPCAEEITMDPFHSKNLHYSYYELYEILPSFRVRHPGSRILRSDNQRFDEEIAATGEGSRTALVEKYKSLTRERMKFSDAMMRFERLAEKVKEDARADVRRQRIERIWEKLAEEGWQEEIAARKAEYEPGLLRIKGVKVTCPLGEKGWAKLRAPLKAFMKGESARVHARITADTCRTRVGQVKAIVELFRFSLPHPHDFYPSTADICWIPEVQKVIIDGTDQEFQHCKVDIQARISGWSTTWLEERRKVFMQLLPQDSPTVEDLSLATTMFDCERCPMHNMHIEEALLHYCYYFYDGGPGERLPNDIISRVYRSDVGSPWDSEFSKYKYSAKFATLVRKAVLECGENPETITTREMSRKHHRFAYFRPGGTINLFSWHQMLGYMRHYGNNPCRFLRPDEFPEHTFEPDGTSFWGCKFWGCIHCWGSGFGKPEWYNKDFIAIKQHLAASHDIRNPTEDDYFPINPH